MPWSKAVGQRTVHTANKYSNPWNSNEFSKMRVVDYYSRYVQSGAHCKVFKRKQTLDETNVLLSDVNNRLHGLTLEQAVTSSF